MLPAPHARPAPSSGHSSKKSRKRARLRRGPGPLRLLAVVWRLVARRSRRALPWEAVCGRFAPRVRENRTSPAFPGHPCRRASRGQRWPNDPSAPSCRRGLAAARRSSSRPAHPAAPARSSAMPSTAIAWRTTRSCACEARCATGPCPRRAAAVTGTHAPRIVTAARPRRTCPCHICGQPDFASPSWCTRPLALAPALPAPTWMPALCSAQ